MSQALHLRGHAVGRYRARSLMREAELAVRKHKYRKAEGEALIAHVRTRRLLQASCSQCQNGLHTCIRLARWAIAEARPQP